ncbi:MAG: hypothetical protein JXL97_09510 [Bacteroidales bacterium]|nr:hypothetical protein [Bacteroidales bacterium]
MEIRLIIRYGIYFVALVLLQTLLFNYVSLGTGLVPFVYILALLLLPIDIQNWILLIFAFVLGFTIDVFNDTMALNTSAMLFAALLRPGVIQILSPRDGYEIGTLPSFKNFKPGRFLAFVSIIVFAHQIVFFSLDIFNFSKIGVVFLKTIINTVLSVAFIMILHLLFFKNNK